MTTDGALTFLFTDIEGSTRLLTSHGEDYQSILLRHREIIAGSINAHGGEVVDSPGEEFFAVFGNPVQAVLATVEAQQSIAAEPWPRGLVVKVRMGLHTGTAERVDGGFIGLDVHRGARVTAAAYGGQTIVSRTTAELVRNDLSREISLRDLGPHRFKDLARPEKIYQIDAPGMADSFPPPRTLDSHPNNLPIQSAPFVGRVSEIVEARELLGATRLLTFTGAGGTGKTRLGLQLAAEVLEQFADGVFFVSLAAVTDPASTPGSIALALSVSVREGEDVVDALNRHLRPLQVLLVLDNFEQIVGSASVVARLLESCPRLKVLVTSREPLRLREEQEYPVPPLGVPQVRESASDSGIANCEAVALFVLRARAVDPGFDLTIGNAQAVAGICVRLDGLPLSIELAAARMKLFTPNALLERFGERFRIITSARRDIPERQQTLRKTIDWSYDLLETAEKQLFARLAVFSGGFTLEAAETVSASVVLPAILLDVIDGIESLLNKSLLKRQEASSDHDGRLGMLETIREYAIERLEEQPECALIRDEHARFYANLAERLRQPTDRPDATIEDDLTMVRQLGAEYQNIVTALEWATGGGNVSAAFKLLGNSMVFFYDQGLIRELAFWADKLRDRDSGVDPVDRARVHFVFGNRARRNRDLEEARIELELAAQLAREGGDSVVAAQAVLMAFGVTSELDGDLFEIDREAERMFEFLDSVGNPGIVSGGHNNVGEVYRLRGMYEEALAEYDAAIGLAGPGRAHLAVVNRGFCLWRLGRLDEAEASFRQVLCEERDGTRSPSTISGGALGMACVASDLARAAVLVGASDALVDSIGIALEPVDQSDFDLCMESVRSQLDSEIFERQSQLGRGMNIDEVIEYALEEPGVSED